VHQSDLKVHWRGKQLGKDVDFDKVVRRTPGAHALCILWRDLLLSLAAAV
jgi:hypothetical protein